MKKVLYSIIALLFFGQTYTANSEAYDLSLLPSEKKARTVTRSKTDSLPQYRIDSAIRDKKKRKFSTTKPVDQTQRQKMDIPLQLTLTNRHNPELYLNIIKENANALKVCSDEYIRSVCRTSIEETIAKAIESGLNEKEIHEKVPNRFVKYILKIRSYDTLPPITPEMKAKILTLVKTNCSKLEKWKKYEKNPLQKNYATELIAQIIMITIQLKKQNKQFTEEEIKSFSPEELEIFNKIKEEDEKMFLINP